MQGKYAATAQTGVCGGKGTAGPWASASESGRQASCDDTEFVTLGGLVVGPKPFGTKGL